MLTRTSPIPVHWTDNDSRKGDAGRSKLPCKPQCWFEGGSHLCGMSDWCDSHPIHWATIARPITISICRSMYIKIWAGMERNGHNHWDGMGHPPELLIPLCCSVDAGPLSTSRELSSLPFLLSAKRTTQEEIQEEWFFLTLSWKWLTSGYVSWS